MSTLTLYDSGTHKNILLGDHTSGEMVPANQHLIIHNGKGMLLDPGGHKVQSAVYSGISSFIPPNDLEILFFSHQDPDVVAAANFWFLMTDAKGFVPEIWFRFVAHFGIDGKLMERMEKIPDRGMRTQLNGSELIFIPAHFIHSSGNAHVYDPVSKIFYSGDLGAAADTDYQTVEDFEAHIPAIEGFHRRYMPNSKALKLWARMVRQLDIEIIAPQHGAMYMGKEVVNQFIDWVDNFSCGVDVMEDIYQVPA